MRKWLLAALHGVVGFFFWVMVFNLALALLALSDPVPEVAEEAGQLAWGCLFAAGVFAALHARSAFRSALRREAPAADS